METEQDPEILFRQIVEKARGLGLNGKQLASMKSVKELAAKRRKRARLSQCHLLAAVGSSLAVALAVIVYWELYTLPGFARFWLTWDRRDIYSEKCTIEMPPTIHDVCRPPVNCSMCMGVSQVDRVSAISPEEFKTRYAYSGRPVVITDGTKNWTAPSVFSFSFFKSIYSEGTSASLDNFRQDCQFFPYQTEFRSLAEVFRMNEDRAQMRGGSPPWYIGWSNCDSSAADILRHHYRRPYFLPLDAESSKTDWIFMGSPGYGAHMHIDHVGNPSWQAQITGRKHWFLEPPPECYHECNSLQVTVEPGEIKTNWWYHKTLIVGDEMSITIGSEYD